VPHPLAPTFRDSERRRAKAAPDRAQVQRALPETLTSKQLVQMVTTNAARVLGLQGVLGSLETGKKADLMVIKGDICAPPGFLGCS
jgi:cytosine/adenosine deaminase-related metal-dependent hydrolase